MKHEISYRTSFNLEEEQVTTLQVVRDWVLSYIERNDASKCHPERSHKLYQQYVRDMEHTGRMPLSIEAWHSYMKVLGYPAHKVLTYGHAVDVHYLPQPTAPQESKPNAPPRRDGSRAVQVIAPQGRAIKHPGGDQCPLYQHVTIYSSLRLVGPIRDPWSGAPGRLRPSPGRVLVRLDAVPSLLLPSEVVREVRGTRSNP